MYYITGPQLLRYDPLANVGDQTSHIQVMHPSFRVAHKPLISFIGKRQWPPGELPTHLFLCLRLLQGHSLNAPTLLRRHRSKEHSLISWRNTITSRFHRLVRAMGGAQEGRYSTSSGRTRSIFGGQKSET